MYKAKFKTAYDQREIVMDVAVIGDVVVGEMVEIKPSTEDRPAICSKLDASTIAGAKEEASHIIAQSDMTMEYGHVPVENRDYRYSDKVASTIDMNKIAPAANASGAEFLGIFDSTDALPSSSSAVTSGDTALVLDTTNDVFDKYVASVASTTVTWTKATSTAAYSISVAEATKKIAAFKITNIDDVNVVEYTI